MEMICPGIFLHGRHDLHGEELDTEHLSVAGGTEHAFIQLSVASAYCSDHSNS